MISCFSHTLPEGVTLDIVIIYDYAPPYPSCRVSDWDFYGGVFILESIITVDGETYEGYISESFLIQLLKKKEGLN